jgi:ribosome-binding protein aMBF1 (putative translation factor)
MSEQRSWTAIKEQRPDNLERRAAYERARLAHELGAKVRTLREERGLSQAELAQRMGTSQSVIARLELGGAEPRLDTLDRICAALEADLIVDLRPRAVISPS